MPLVIGGKPESNFMNPLGLLSDCHRRIEYFLGQLCLVAEQANGGPMNAEQREATEKALRYFEEAAPRHTRDEEDSLFPRMRAQASAQSKEALEALDALEADHGRADEWHAEVDRLGRWWLSEGEIGPDEAARLKEVLGHLESLYRKHIEIEDTFVFPTAGQVLDPATIREVGREMAARRGIDPDAEAAPPPFARRPFGR